jgi:predicted O-linked N-acetylglucosamine transferase (SPINDLY family)
MIDDINFLQIGISLHQQGQIELAKAIYEEILMREPNSFEALHFLGVIASQQNNHTLAVTLIERSIAISPSNPTAFNNCGSALKELNRLEESLERFEAAIKINPQYATAFYNRGVVLNSLNRFDDAILSYEKAIQNKPGYAQAYFNRGVVFEFIGNHQEALVNFTEAIKHNSNYAEAFNNLGVSLKNLNRLDEAIANFENAIQINPNYAEAYNNLGVALKALDNLDKALICFDHALKINAAFAEAHANKGGVFQLLNLFDEAVASYNKSIAIKPDSAEAHNNRALALQKLGFYEDAIVSFNRATEIKCDYVEAYNNLGVVYKTVGRLNDALASFDKSISFNPKFSQAHNNRGLALHELKCLDEAISSFNQAISLAPKYADPYINRGLVLHEMLRFSDAISSFNHAIEIRPDDADAYNNRGLALQQLNRLDEAIDSYKAASIYYPSSPHPYFNLGTLKLSVGKFTEAISYFETAYNLSPDYENLLGMMLHAKMHICDWNGLEKSLTHLKAGILSNKKITPPFPVLALVDDPAMQLRAASIYAHPRIMNNQPSSSNFAPQVNGKIRIGYFSADFHRHATTYLAAELFESHNRDKFEIFGFSFGPEKGDEMHQRVSRAFDKFIDVSGYTDREIAYLSRSFEIDIAVDLKGYTKNYRSRLFAEGCAPIQVNYLGYPGTLGTEVIDYIIADKTIIPIDSRIYFKEKIVYLPNCYQVNDSKRKISAYPASRNEVGLPEQSFVFCCFNSSYKIMPEIFSCWMRLLKTVKNSVLWLLADNDYVTSNLFQAASDCGINSNRLIFAKHLSLDEHLGRHKLADLFLDTLPCNAHTTASDSLWAGLPVLTCAGDSLAGRVAASLLTTLQLPELITYSLQEYETRAIELVSDPERLTNIRLKLKKNNVDCGLFGGQLFAANIENAYTKMYERLISGQNPDHIHIV